MQHFLIIVEGAHDIAFLGKVLKTLNFNEVRRVRELSSLMEKFIPRNFPFVEDKLNIFNFVPFFYEKDNKQVVIVNANGEKNILNKLDVILSEFDLNEIKQINRILIFADGDLKNKTEKIQSILDIDFSLKEFEFLKKEDLSKDNPKVDIYNKFDIDLDYFIFPDNQSKGRLEDIILEAIGLSETDLLINTEKFIREVSQSYKSSWGSFNSKEEKSKIGIVGNILIPGAGNTALLYSDDIDWISIRHKNNINSLEKIYSFLDEKLA